jgi:hypothetical protein
MTVKLKINSDLTKEQLNIIMIFIKFINNKLDLNNDVRIEFVDVKSKDMTTGVRNGHNIKILCKGRMLIDVLRTLAHEWVHEYQHQKMGVGDKQKMLNIGGWGENHANSVSGMLVKEFSKIHKELEDKIY